MKTKLVALIVAATLLGGCRSENTLDTPAETYAAGQSAVQDNDSEKDVIKVAVGSPDHTLLVRAVQTAELADALSNAGPFTVFAPTDAAFKALPAGTLEDLLKPENKEKLVDILQYHVSVAGYPLEYLQDGQNINQVNDSDARISVNEGKYKINNATIVATIKASNGIVHVIDKVILPPVQ